MAILQIELRTIVALTRPSGLSCKYPVYVCIPLRSIYLNYQRDAACQHLSEPEIRTMREGVSVGKFLIVVSTNYQKTTLEEE